MKVDRVGDKKNPGHPKLIPIKNDDHELWFKQDDSFEQPFIVIRGKILMKTESFPDTDRGLALF